MLGSSRRAPSPLALAPLAAALLILGLLAPAMASAAPPPLPLASSTALSPELEALATPAVRSRSLAGQAAALGLPREADGGMVRDGGRVVVEARFDAGAAAALAAVRATGAKVLNVSRRYQTLGLSAAPADLRALAAVPGVVAVTPSPAPQVAALAGARTAAVVSNGLCEGGSVISQGVAQLNVPAARAAFGARGAGETIGVISDSFNATTVTASGAPIPTRAHEDEVTNDLPGRASTCSGQQLPVNVIAEEPIDPEAPPTDEGRAMLQAIHDLAPHAKLAFATGEPTEMAYVESIEKLAAPVSEGGAGADVIVDDLAYPTEPDFQDGPVADAIRRVTEAGVLYFSAAGNDNLFNAAGDEIASWEAPAFRGKPSCNAKAEELLTEALGEVGLGPYEPDCMDFDPGPGVDTEFGITVEPHSPLTVDVQWAEPWFGAETALFAFLVVTEPGGEEAIGDAIGGSEPPVRPVIAGLSWENTSAEPRTAQLVIARCAGAKCNPAASATADPRIKVALAEDGGGVSETDYPTSAGGDIVGPVIQGHGGSPYVTTIGAVNFGEPRIAPRAPEPYSSRGPVTHYFGPVTGPTPAAPLGAAEVIQKPDLTATDCASNTFFGILAGAGWHFCGTSQAAEHAATVAALMRQTAPLASPASILAALAGSATKFTTVTSPDAVGAGLVNALAAMKALGGSPVEDPPSYVVPSPEEEEMAGPPSVRITNGPGALSSQSRPTFEFTSTRPVAFTCQLDGGTPQPCASPYLLPAPLADGSHGFVVIGKDAQGRGGSSGVYDFGIDTKAPRTKIVGHPQKVVKTRKRSVVVHFRLKASESPVTFYCEFDKEPLRICPASFRHRFKKGKHAVRIRAKDQVGNIAEKPTVFHFRVKELPPKHSAKKGKKAHHPR